MSSLRLVNETSISSSVTGVNITDIFSADFDIYKMTLKGISLAGGTATRIDCRLINTSGSVITSSLYERASLSMHSNASFQELTSVNADTMFDFCPATDEAPETSSSVIYFFNPFLSSSYTFMAVEGFSSLSGNSRSAKSIFVLKELSSIGGVNLFSGGGDNFSSGVIRTYGLRVD
jgi:hypothetical protein